MVPITNRLLTRRSVNFVEVIYSDSNILVPSAGKFVQACLIH